MAGRWIAEAAALVTLMVSLAALLAGWSPTSVLFKSQGERRPSAAAPQQQWAQAAPAPPAWGAAAPQQQWVPTPPARDTLASQQPHVQAAPDWQGQGQAQATLASQQSHVQAAPDWQGQGQAQATLASQQPHVQAAPDRQGQGQACDGIPCAPLTNASGAYLYRSRAKVFDKPGTVGVSSAPGDVCLLIKEAVGSNRMKCNALGVDFRGMDLQDAKRIVPYFPLPDTMLKLFDSDSEARMRAPAMAERYGADPRLFTSLTQDGFVRIDDFGLDIQALKAEVQALMRRENVDRNKPFHYTGSEFQSMRPLLSNERFLGVARAYFGGQPAELTGYSVLHLGPKVKTSLYRSGEWHHDRCGRRLKMFINVDKVGENDHATKVAKGTQAMAYYGMHSDGLTRFDGNFVQRVYGDSIEAMTGPAGGGFLFDTNAVHKGDVDGVQSVREVVIVEFHPISKVKTSSCPGVRFKVAKRLT